MMMKLSDGYIFVKASEQEEATIKSWRLMTKDRKNNWWYGKESLQLLQKLYQAFGLTKVAKKRMDELLRIRSAVDAERIRPNEELKPLTEYPVKAKLYSHQVRAANMALMIFELAEGKE